MFKIEFTPESLDDMSMLRKHERRRIFGEIEKQLKHQPEHETRNRKKLRPNQIAEWELCVDNFRIFYDIDKDEKTVKIATVGYKIGSKLFIHGEEYEL